MPEYLLPDVGEGLTEAEIVSWKVKVGDTVAINDIVCEIETAKSIVELPSPFAGVVSAILAPEGETIPVGTPIVAIGDDAAAEGGAAPATPEPAAAAEMEELLRRKPDYLAAYLQLGLLLQTLGKGDAARDALVRGQAVAQEQGNTHTLSELTQALQSL